MNLKPKPRRADAGSRRFFDEFTCIKVGGFRASGVVDPAKNYALIRFPNDREKLIHTQHCKLRHGGGWSFFVCPKCNGRASKLYLIEDAPLCRNCCNRLNIHHRSRMGFGNAERVSARRKALDQLNERLLQPGITRRKRLTANARRSMITLRLGQLAHAPVNTSARSPVNFTPHPSVQQLIDIRKIWQAKSLEQLDQALDKAEETILNALHNPDPKVRLTAAKVMLRTPYAKALGL